MLVRFFYQELVFHLIRTQPTAPVRAKHLGRSGASFPVASLKYTPLLNKGKGGEAPRPARLQWQLSEGWLEGTFQPSGCIQQSFSLSSVRYSSLLESTDSVTKSWKFSINLNLFFFLHFSVVDLSNKSRGQSKVLLPTVGMSFWYG